MSNVYDICHMLLDVCGMRCLNMEEAVFCKMPKYTGSNVHTGKKLQWCLEWRTQPNSQPSRIFLDGHEEWCWDGELHRGDGPAVITRNGKRRFFTRGREVE